MARHIGMYRRSVLRGLPPGDVDLRRAVAAALQAGCVAGRHRPETDADTGNEVCRVCREVVDDYPEQDGGRPVNEHGILLARIAVGARVRVEGLDGPCTRQGGADGLAHLRGGRR